MSYRPRFLSDEDFSGPLVAALRQAAPDMDLVRVQDVGLTSKPDTEVLAWAEQHDRILLTHDLQTMPGHAADRLMAGQRIAGVCVVPKTLRRSEAVPELVLIAGCSLPGDWQNRITILPL